MNVKRLDFPDRELFILADGDWRGFRSGACAKEPETVEWLRRVAPGSVVWDVGASVGPYSLVATALGAEQVVAFEPYGPSYGHLCQNISINKLDGLIDPWPVALANADRMSGWMTFTPATPGIGSGATEGISQPVVQIGVDAWFRYMGIVPPSHVKVDVDGGELSVIESGRNLWKSVQSILVESTERGIEDIALILSGCGLEQTGKWERSGGMFNYLWERTGD